jgi:hypothetical protein
VLGVLTQLHGKHPNPIVNYNFISDPVAKAYSLPLRAKTATVKPFNTIAN